MSDISPDAVSRFLTVLRTLPVWLLAGIAAAAWALLYVPPFGGVDLISFRTAWGVWIAIAAVVFSVLTATRALDLIIATWRVHRRRKSLTRALRFVPLHHRCWWHLAKQRDDSFISQIGLHVEASNVTDRPVRILRTRLVYPRARGGVAHAEVLLPMAGSPYHSSRHAVPPHDVVTASVHIMARGILARQGKPLRVTLGLTDQFGDEYLLRRISIPTHDAPLAEMPFAERLNKAWQRLTTSDFASRGKPEAVAEAIPAEWDHNGKYEEVDVILNEEQRNYAACGRERGGLGSLNVGLQSEPNAGWTETTGDLPTLLWDRADAKAIGSPNAATLMKLHQAMAPSDREKLEAYLLSHLNKQSRYADVAYFIFFVLHRVGRTTDGLQAARSNLAGDKVFGYSNLLGTLSALVSREYCLMDPALFSSILAILDGDAEHNFRLTEKLNLARLRAIDDGLSTDPVAAS